MCQHLWTCRHVLICADMCQHVKPLSAPLIPTIWTSSCMLACVSTFGHADMCWHVPTYDINLVTSDSDHLYLIQMLACVSNCEHANMCSYVPACADMCRHVPTCGIDLDTSDSDHLDLIQMLECVSTFGHADMCQHVKPLSVPLIRTIWILSCMLACVSTFGHAIMCQHVLTCVDMCWHVTLISTPLIAII